MVNVGLYYTWDLPNPANEAEKVLTEKCRRKERGTTNTQVLTIFYVAGDFVQQHQASVQVTDVLLYGEAQRHFEDTVVFSCPELKHKLLLSNIVRFHFVPLHGHSWKTEGDSEAGLEVTEHRSV